MTTTAIVPYGAGCDIRTKRGQTVLVEPCLRSFFQTRSVWVMCRGYPAVAGGRSGAELCLHVLTLGSKPGHLIHHVNGNRLDARLGNLKHLTAKAHATAHRWRFGRGAELSEGAWRARTRCPRVHGGCYATREIAILAVDALARKRNRPGYESFWATLEVRDLRRFLRGSLDEDIEVCFVKRTTGRVRHLVCRPAEVHLGPHEGTIFSPPGPGLRFNPTRRGLFAVFVPGSNEYRFIPLENVLWVSVKGHTYRVRRTPRTRSSRRRSTAMATCPA